MGGIVKRIPAYAGMTPAFAGGVCPRESAGAPLRRQGLAMAMLVCVREREGER